MLKRWTWPALCSSLFFGGPAVAGDKAECSKGYEKAQEFKAEKQYRSARAMLLKCVKPACPAFVRKDCTKWIGEVEAATPSAVFSAQVDGQELTDVRVLSGEEVIVESLDGKAVPLDPGRMTFTFESDQHGSTEVTMLIKEGQKNQSIEASFSGTAAEGNEKGTASASIEPDTSAGGNDKTLAYIFGGVGVLGIASFAYFASAGSSEEDDLDCAGSKTCTDEELDPIKQKYLIADISLGVGIVSLGVAAYFFFKPEPQAEQGRGRISLDISPTNGGGFAALSGQF